MQNVVIKIPRGTHKSLCNWYGEYGTGTCRLDAAVGNRVPSSEGGNGCHDPGALGYRDQGASLPLVSTGDVLDFVHLGWEIGLS